MRHNLKLELVFYTAHNHPFYSFCENIKIVIEGLKIRYPIFIIEQRDYDLILG